MSVFITATHHKPATNEITGFSFDFQFAGRKVTGSISEVPLQSSAEQIDVLRQELRQLGEALIEAANSPKGVFVSQFPKERS